MSLKNEFVQAWKASEDHNALLELVHRHQARGISAQDAYLNSGWIPGSMMLSHRVPCRTTWNMY
jgi:hypothetical protein